MDKKEHQVIEKSQQIKDEFKLQLLYDHLTNPSEFSSVCATMVMVLIDVLRSSGLDPGEIKGIWSCMIKFESFKLIVDENDHMMANLKDFTL